jgi:hypothetical protein
MVQWNNSAMVLYRQGIFQHPIFVPPQIHFSQLLFFISHQAFFDYRSLKFNSEHFPHFSEFVVAVANDSNK